ncbi:hypothetical protein GGR52DRAFT_445065 [Hypoxylon sp. FL1284]|nr:hypothetical protein GGR52DRAFT_445065 [Hypoxylon sp. FL1284]
MPEGQPSGVDLPSPLRVIKRGKSMQVLSPRKISIDSLDDGPDQPLTVVKSRKSKASVVKNESSNNDLGPAHDESSKENQPDTVRKTSSCLPWDPITPKPRKIPTSRRSSSMQVGRPLSPTFLSRLRSLSTRRSSSSKTTRRNTSATLSESSDESIFKLSDESAAAPESWDPTSTLINPAPLSYLDEFEASSFDSDSFMSSQRPDVGIYDPYMLVPRISITPEAKASSDGQSSIWMAIEISGQLSHPRVGNSTHNGGAAQAPFIPAHHCDPGLSRYGYLYNIRVDILPTVGNSVVDVIGDTTFSTISPGSSLLVIACIRLGTWKGYQPRPSKRNSDSLMSDIEFQLGNAKLDYAQVRLGYCHSGFPASQEAPIDGDTSTCHTRLETVTTGTVSRHDPVSAWSPQPAPPSNPLFAIVASHWGPTRANEVMHRITSSRPSRRRPGNWTSAVQADRNEDGLRPPGTAPPIPGRYGSLRRLSPRKVADPARKIWTELRQTSSDSRPASRAGKATRVPAGAVAFADAPRPPPRYESMARPESRLEVHRQREAIREAAVRNKRSIGADSLKSLVPSIPDADHGCKENYAPDCLSPPSGKEDDGHFDGRRREGRWSLGSWWQ